MSRETMEVRLLANETRALANLAFSDAGALPPGGATLCTAIHRLADAVQLLAVDADSTGRVLASRTEHLA